MVGLGGTRPPPRAVDEAPRANWKLRIVRCMDGVDKSVLLQNRHNLEIRFCAWSNCPSKHATRRAFVSWDGERGQNDMFSFGSKVIWVDYSYNCRVAANVVRVESSVSFFDTNTPIQAAPKKVKLNNSRHTANRPQ
jgi:hypothetical protein